MKGALAVSLLAVCIVTLISSRDHASTDHIRVQIGVIPNTFAGERAALRRLADEIKSHPKAQVYEVDWTSSWEGLFHLDGEYDRHDIMYERKEERLWQGDYNGSGGYDKVTEQMITDIAKAHGPISDFAKYGCPEFP